MTTAQGQRVILLSAVTVLGVETLKAALTDKEFSTRLFVGGGITYTALAGLSEFAPNVAAAFSLLVMTTVLMQDGVTVGSRLMANTKKD